MSDLKTIAKDMLYCTGCRACEKVCVSGAISMIKNAEGFLFPHKDETKCINCGKCRDVCPAENPVELREPLKVYAAVHKDDAVLKDSSSGGAFTAVSDIVFERGGVVVGCAFDKDFYARQVMVSNKNRISECRGSKYVQSDTLDTFSQVKKLLDDGVFVLYTGTPCQIAGLKNYLGEDYENLLTADFICHGVPSPELFKQHISWLEKKNKDKIVNYRFRSKVGSYRFGLYYYYYFGRSTKAVGGSAALDPYYYNFLNAKTYRECCYKCLYAQEKRLSDFTFADFWSVEKFHPDIDSDMGASILLFNTEKSLRYQTEIEKNMMLFPSRMEWMKQINFNLNRPADRPDSRSGIYKKIQELGYEKWAEQYCSEFIWKLRYIYGKLPLGLRARVKMIRKNI